MNRRRRDGQPSSFPRALDIILSAAGLIFLSPLFAIVAVLVRVSSPGPVFHRAVRTGWRGRAFTLYKFRTMYDDAGGRGPGVTYGDDPRVTTIGRWLRRWKLDEFPQLFNVLKGEMCLVGPRPEDPRFIPFYPEGLRGILDYKPGITSPASVRYRNESTLLAAEDPEAEYISHILPEKLRMDLAYFHGAGFLDHVRLLWGTVFGGK